MGKQWKQWQTLFWGAPKSLQMLTVACSLQEKLGSILKNRDITLLTKVCLVKATVFLVVIYGWESWTAGGQREEFRPWQRSWGRRLGICKGMIKPQEIPCSRASTPQTRVCFMLSPIPLILWGLSPITISLREGVNLQLQLIKIPGDDKSVSTYELWRFSGLPDQARPAACDCLQPPNCERHGMF